MRIEIKMKCDFCTKERKYYAYPSYCTHRFCMECTMNEVFKEVKCPFCSQYQQSIVHNLTQDENLITLPLSDPNKIKKFIGNMLLAISIENENVDQSILETNKKLFLEEIENEETEELTDFNINSDD